jgi:hypothetical protein
VEFEYSRLFEEYIEDSGRTPIGISALEHRGMVSLIEAYVSWDPRVVEGGHL